MYDLNLLRVLFSRKFFGNLFQSTAAAKEKALSPNVFVLVFGTTKYPSPSDRRLRVGM